MLLQANLKKAIAERRLGGSLVLRELARQVAPYRTEANLGQQAVAFAIHHFLRAAEYDHDERSYGANENNTFIEKSGPILLRAVEFLKNGGTPDSALDIITSISNLENELLPF